MARRGDELAFRLFGRSVRPFHLAVTISTGTIAVTNLNLIDPVAVTVVGPSLGLLAAVSTVLLTLAWWGSRDVYAEWGLLLACGVWAGRSLFIILDQAAVIGRSSAASVALSVAWAVGAGGAYLLERYESHALSDA